MSARSSVKHGPYRKPRADIYTLMLALALVAIILGCVCLHLEVRDMPIPPGAARLADPATSQVLGIAPTGCVAVAERCDPYPANGWTTLVRVS